jgi:hypothetical protein
LAEELVGVLVGVVEAREGRKEREIQDKEWTSASGRGVAEAEGAV